MSPGRAYGAMGGGGGRRTLTRRELRVGPARHLFVGQWLGSGGVGEVYSGQCDGIPGEVLLKTLRSDYDAQDLGWAAMLAMECKVLRYLEQRNYPAPRLLARGDFGHGRAGMWFLMTRVPGISLEAWLQANSRAPVQRKLGILAGLAEAVASLHRLRVVHLDLKPANIFVEEGGRRCPRVELIDFGNARILSEARPNMNEAISFDYAAPEHFGGLAGCREPADHFVLGLLCAEVLTGALPFGRIPRVREQALAMLRGGSRQAVAARLRASGVQGALADFVAGRLLAFDVAMRGEGATELAVRLGRAPGTGGGVWRQLFGGILS